MLFDFEAFGKSAQNDAALIKKVTESIIGWIAKCEATFNLKEIVVNETILADVVRKTFEDLQRYRRGYNPYQRIDIPSHIRDAAHLAYWIRRLKPLSYIPDPGHQVNLEYQKEFIRWINEKTAIRVAEFLCSLGEKKYNGRDVATFIPHSLREDFLYMFRYKHISPHSLMIILKSNYCERR